MSLICSADRPSAANALTAEVIMFAASAVVDKPATPNWAELSRTAIASSAETPAERTSYKADDNCPSSTGVRAAISRTALPIESMLSTLVSTKVDTLPIDFSKADAARTDSRPKFTIC